MNAGVAMPTSSSSPIAGTDTLVAGRYRLLEKLGDGEMGTVFLARDERLKPEVALKTIRSAANGQGPASRLRARFDREARAAARIRHPHVVTLFDAGSDAGLDYLVMERLVGRDLRSYLADVGRIPVDEALTILQGAADALAAGHRAGLLHRDVTPSNIFIEVDPDTGGHRVRLPDCRVT